MCYTDRDLDGCARPRSTVLDWIPSQTRVLYLTSTLKVFTARGQIFIWASICWHLRKSTESRKKSSVLGNYFKFLHSGSPWKIQNLLWVYLYDFQTICTKMNLFFNFLLPLNPSPPKNPTFIWKYKDVCTFLLHFYFFSRILCLTFGAIRVKLCGSTTRSFTFSFQCLLLMQWSLQ